jgi:hypothetical protein
MPETVAEPSSSRCSSAAPGTRFQQNQRLGPDLGSGVLRDARGCFAKGCSGNPRGRPPGIRNPRRRVPDLAARRLGTRALSDLIGRKPHLLRPLAKQLLPPPLAYRDPAKRLGLDLSALHSAEDFVRLLAGVLAAVARGKITPDEGARIARRVRARLRHSPGYKRRRTTRPLPAMQPVYGAARPCSTRAPRTGDARGRRPLPIGICGRRNVNEAFPV